MVESDKTSVFGIRHHGPGSARSLLKALTTLAPDCILVEGPPDADELIKHVSDPGLKPPAAILIYAPDDFSKAVYYPFALFSPEWQALVYACRQSIPVRFMDLPQKHWLALADRQASRNESEQGEPQEEAAGDDFMSRLRADPLAWLARAAGYEDGERWWEAMVEHRRADLEIFPAIEEAVAALRRELSADEAADDRQQQLREACMRQTVRAALKEGFSKIAVVCGAWHAPALSRMPPAKEDQALLKGLPKVRVEATWIPWTHGRLSLESGYGAGIRSPGWYHHLWTAENHIVERWLSNVARLLQEQDLDASPAHVIEAVRLAEALAALRGEPLPGLVELSESVQSIFCCGNPLPMQLIHDRLVVGDLIGEVPPDIPGTPLQKDLERQQKCLRLPATSLEKVFDLDLRNHNDLRRSHLLHRLEILKINWGVKQEVSGKSGTFHEVWQLRWRPEFVMAVIEASVWGKTMEEAAGAFACAQSEKAAELAGLTGLLALVLKADLPGAVNQVVRRLENEAAVASDVKHLMAALPALVETARYGDVRKTDLSSLEKIVCGLLSRICVGLPPACSTIDENAAQEIFELLLKVNSSVNLLQNQDHECAWQETLLKLVEANAVNGLISGRACRILFEKKVLNAQEAAGKFALALSTACRPESSAAFADGFLRGSGTILIHDSRLFAVVDDWVQTLNEEAFKQILPLMRRTFSTFSPPERRQIGRQAARGALPGSESRQTDLCGFSQARMEKVQPVLLQILGLKQADKAGEL